MTSTIVHNGVEYQLPACPDCGSARKRCMRPSGHEAAEWHVARVRLFDQVNAELLAAQGSDIFDVRACRSCGCTDADCSECIAVTGSPCWWVEYDLCSRCGVAA